MESTGGLEGSSSDGEVSQVSQGCKLLQCGMGVLPTEASTTPRVRGMVCRHPPPRRVRAEAQTPPKPEVAL